MRNLQLYSTASIDHLLLAEPKDPTFLDASALDIFTDFDVARPILIDHSTSAIGTAKIMEKTHAHMRLVVDGKDNFLGIVTDQELTQHNLLITAKASHQNINDVLVTDVMIARDKLQAFDYHEIATAKVRDVLRLLKENNLHHILVIDHKLNHIRGLIAASDLAEKVYVPFEVHERPSFSQIIKHAN
jgi:CBS domain containing-hemolysin-like protein